MKKGVSIDVTGVNTNHCFWRQSQDLLIAYAILFSHPYG